MKTKEEVLNQLYVSAYDIQILIPNYTYQNALDYIKRIREKMREKNMFLPVGKTNLALTKIVIQDLGIKS